MKDQLERCEHQGWLSVDKKIFFCKKETWEWALWNWDKDEETDYNHYLKLKHQKAFQMGGFKTRKAAASAACSILGSLGIKSNVSSFSCLSGASYIYNTNHSHIRFARALAYSHEKVGKYIGWQVFKTQHSSGEAFRLTNVPHWEQNTYEHDHEFFPTLQKAIEAYQVAEREDW